MAQKAEAICAAPKIRDANPRAFLQNLIYYTATGAVGVSLSASDGPKPLWLLAQGSDVTLFILEGAARCAKIEAKALAMLTRTGRRAKVITFTAQAFHTNPDAVYHKIKTEISAQAS